MTKLFPVIHWTTDDIALENASIAAAAGCDGVFLIDMNGGRYTIDKAAELIKARFPALLVGANRLGMRPQEALEYDRAHGLDATWCDRSGAAGSGLDRTAREASQWLANDRAAAGKHLYFAGVAFKYQDPEPDPGQAASWAERAGFIPTTSGEATGKAADAAKVREMKGAIGQAALAIASGISPENAAIFKPYCGYMLAATRISRDFARLDPERVAMLRKAIAVLPPREPER